MPYPVRLHVAARRGALCLSKTSVTFNTIKIKKALPQMNHDMLGSLEKTAQK